jgi:hypothetical protein
MTVLTPSEAFLGIPYPQHLSGQTKVTSFLYPGAVQPLTTVTVLTSSEAFLGISFPQHLVGQSKIRSFLFPGALQPNLVSYTLMPQACL